MKKIAVIILIFILQAVHAQEEIAISDFVPQVFLFKNDIFEKYQFKSFNYESTLLDWEKKSKEEFKIFSKNEKQIIYNQIDRAFSDTITHVLDFNEHKQLKKWEIDVKDCYDRKSSDVPEPLISKVDITYNANGLISGISGHCKSNEYATNTIYHYNESNHLDSIIFSEGYSNQRIFQKVIFVDTTIFSGETKSSMVLILNTTFDYKRWLQVELNETIINSETQTGEISSLYRAPKMQEFGDGAGTNFVYEFDSLCRITSLRTMNSNAEYIADLPTFGCDFCDANCDGPSVVEFYYQKDKISGIEMASFSAPNEAGKLICRCFMKFSYRKDKIKEILFYNGLDYFSWILVKKWNKRKGFFIPKDISSEIK
jgi:hypothetical protein